MRPGATRTGIYHRRRYIIHAVTTASMDRDSELRHHYGAYGVQIVSDRPLELPQHRGESLRRVEILHDDEAAFPQPESGLDEDAPPQPWHRYAFLADGSAYARWNGVGEFHVASDGHRMTCRQFARASAESFHVYMLGQALSCALINQGIEPFHATAVAVNEAAVAFVGGNGFGKSTLAAAFVRRGFPLVTDDMLVVDEAGGRLLAHPGPPRLKLFPQIARRVLGVTDDLGAMNSETPKRILPLTGSSACPTPIPLGAIYILAAPRHTARCVGISAESLAPRAAFVEMLGAAFNRRRLGGAARVERQFHLTVRISETVPVTRLHYPRIAGAIGDVVQAVLADL